MAVYLWNWYPEIDENGKVTVKGIRQGALDTWIPSYTVVNYPDYRCKMETDESFDLKLEADYCRGRLEPDSPLLFYLLCRMAWEPGRWKWSKADSWLMHRSHYYAVTELMRARKELRLKEMQKPAKLLKIMRSQEMLLEIGSGEPFFMRRAYWRNAVGAISDETKSIRRGGGDISPALIYYSGENHDIEDSCRENKPQKLYFSYICSSKPCNLLEIAGKWKHLTYYQTFLRVRNVGEEPLCIFGKEGVPGYVIPPGRQYVMNEKEITSCESRPWEMLKSIPWMRNDFSLSMIKSQPDK